MPSEVAVGEQLRRPLAAAAAAAGKGQQGAAAAAAAGGAEQEQLACPRCDSTNTKFCYYNNYNFSQPRHFCKACRRYWTHGGTLRDIPVGGGSRKNAKRSRTAPLSSAPLSASPVLLPPLSGGGAGGGSFTSLLNTQGPGFLALGGFGLGLGSGLDELGFGLGRGIWALGGGGGGGGGGGEGVGGNGGGARGMGATWQFEGGDHRDHQYHHHHHHHLLQHHNHHGVAAAGGAVGDFYSWAEPVVSTPGSGLK